MDRVLELLADVIHFDGARIYLFEDGMLQLKAARGIMRGLQKAIWPQIEPNDPSSSFAEVLQTGQAILEREVPDPSLLGEPGAGSEWGSWMAVPIHWHGEVKGIFTLTNRLPGFFQPLNLEIVDAVAQQLGVALENSRLLDRSHQRAEKIKIVQEIGRSSVSLLDSQLLVYEAAQRVVQLFDYDQVGIFMVEEDVLAPEIYLYGEELKERKGVRNIPLNAGTIFDEAVRDNVPVLIPSLKPGSGMEYIPGTGNARSAMLIPLSIKGAVVGVLLVLSHKQGGVDTRDIEILQVLAAQLGISLVNARLFSEVRAHAAMLEQRVSERTEELQSQKERTEAILRSVADAVMVLDLEGRLVLANPKAQDLLAGSWSEELYERVVSLRHGIPGEHVEWEFGTASFEALASSVEMDDQEIGTVIVLREITRLKELDRLKSQFVATVSHELRTPLANITLYLSLLRRNQGDRDPHYYETLERETERLTIMIEDLLDLSRLDAQREVKFDRLRLRNLLAEIAEGQQPVCESKRIELIYLPEGDPIILANRDHLIQVFTNLIANAIAYTPAGEKIQLRLSSTVYKHDRPGVNIEVEDSGVGIPTDELPYVFDRFYRGRMAQQLKIHGSGLGLAIVREIVEGHGGDISVQSDIGQGTCFQLWLPLAEGGENENG
jgi:signal transduction histidine kinase